MTRFQPLRCFLFGIAIGISSLVSCACDQTPDDPATALVRKGRTHFESVCTACHARDPRQPGPVGPEIAGSSLELLRAKVLHNEYPPGYLPKRSTQAMIPLPYLEAELPAIEAYLATFEQ
ncbi:MAG: cytochrome c [bacterium]|nr:cytochrome c [bacterium]MCP5065902.1 cytochrome c [bacterium]